MKGCTPVTLNDSGEPSAARTIFQRAPRRYTTPLCNLLITVRLSAVHILAEPPPDRGRAHWRSNGPTSSRSSRPRRSPTIRRASRGGARSSSRATAAPRRPSRPYRRSCSTTINSGLLDRRTSQPERRLRRCYPPFFLNTSETPEAPNRAAYVPRYDGRRARARLASRLRRGHVPRTDHRPSDEGRFSPMVRPCAP